MKRYIRATSIYVDDLSKGDLLSELNSLKHELTAGDDFAYETRSGIFVCIAWSKPGINTNWYPLVSVEYKGEEVFNREGTENPDYWYKIVDEAIAVIKGLR